MTTKVIITSQKPNHEDALVIVRNPTSGAGYARHRLTDGEQVEVYVHSGSELVVSEIPKSAETPA